MFKNVNEGTKKRKNLLNDFSVAGWTDRQINGPTIMRWMVVSSLAAERSMDGQKITDTTRLKREVEYEILGRPTHGLVASRLSVQY